ncbi:hemerythrin domain-containing protein [Nonomuraea terrae]|uniref:Hemerythrin domain-containing protein n=1 Tax=Nonomuraea terrae TaxID=2530383 RepID=A0A4R4YVZ8_9ACTN|nr:hemerythrin domain-containing protein [Nonomuraea terrae]TDD48529.1 hemerythrin domain-containing protein [Nonomuraea terrae]
MTMPLADASDMFVVHTMFRREFGSMPGLVRGVAAGDERRAEVVAGHVALINGVLHHHHAGEDAHVWPRLLERVPAPCGWYSVPSGFLVMPGWVSACG